MIADRAALARIAEVQNPKAPALLGDKVEARAIRLVPLHFCVGVAHVSRTASGRSATRSMSCPFEVRRVNAVRHRVRHNGPAFLVPHWPEMEAW